MPRKPKKKQTRLAFAPTAASGDSNEDEIDRFARLSYSHPNLATVRPEIPRRTKPASPPVTASSSTTTSRPKASPVKESEQEKKEKQEKKDKKGKMEKKEKKDKNKRNLKEQEEERRHRDTDPSLTLQWIMG
jgi:hypothetical protein